SSIFRPAGHRTADEPRTPTLRYWPFTRKGNDPDGPVHAPASRPGRAAAGHRRTDTGLQRSLDGVFWRTRPLRHAARGRTVRGHRQGRPAERRQRRPAGSGRHRRLPAYRSGLRRDRRGDRGWRTAHRPWRLGYRATLPERHLRALARWRQLNVRRMRVHGHPQGCVVLKGCLQRAEQEGEARGGIECLPDLSVTVSGKPAFGDAQVSCVVLIRDELELDRGGMRGVVTIPGETDAPAGLNLIDPHLCRGVVHLPFPREFSILGHSPGALGETRTSS